jgi:hypothetical protein
MDYIREKAESSIKQLRQFYMSEKLGIEAKLIKEKKRNFHLTESIEGEF